MPTKFCPGDHVICKLNYGTLARANSIEFERTYVFYIVCLHDDERYLLLVPNDVYLAKSFVLTAKDCREFGLANKFIDSEVYFAKDKHIVGVQSRVTGLSCFRCGEHQEYGEINRLDADGHGILVCWSCRTYPYR